jgi:hypothetical protein
MVQVERNRMTQLSDLELAFHKDMLNIYNSAKLECGYHAMRFLQMVGNNGGLLTAKKLLATKNPSDGFAELWRCKRLDLTVEYLVLKPKYQCLFSEEERATARERLKSVNFIV